MLQHKQRTNLYSQLNEAARTRFSAATGGDDEEVPGDIINKTEIVTNSGNNNPFSWLLKLLEELLVKYATYALDKKYQAYVKFANDAMSLVNNAHKIVVIFVKLVGSAVEALKSASNGAEAGKGKTEAKLEAGKTEGAAENDKAKVRPEEEKAKREGSVNDVLVAKTPGVNMLIGKQHLMIERERERERERAFRQAPGGRWDSLLLRRSLWVGLNSFGVYHLLC
ncbi:hypothetical protein Dsin_020099 [Dipteronia sinensis]|uniref:Uncharacterized protein n=1 Tax=Dipteronia sinensis TaxID=43782 RepID=A0AAE0E3F4_9ROSI|nr:hypothetical protein Dsin_020099 [Dipteronia sinensis]